jgi:hypothetical protein
MIQGSNRRRDALARGRAPADDEAMTRALRLAGAGTVVLSLWLTWYEIRIPDELRRVVDTQAGQLPQGLGDFARGLLAALPSSISANGWQAFEGADVALVLLAGAVAFSVFLAVDPRAILAAAAAIAGLVLVHILDQPGPNQIVSVRLGPWVALVGAVAIALSARTEETTKPLADPWAPPAPEAWSPPAAASVPPPT